MEKQLASYDPGNGELLGEVQTTSASQIDAMAEKARFVPYLEPDLGKSSTALHDDGK